MLIVKLLLDFMEKKIKIFLYFILLFKNKRIHQFKVDFIKNP